MEEYGDRNREEVQEQFEDSNEGPQYSTVEARTTNSFSQPADTAANSAHPQPTGVVMARHQQWLEGHRQDDEAFGNRKPLCLGPLAGHTAGKVENNPAKDKVNNEYNEQGSLREPTHEELQRSDMNGLPKMLKAPGDISGTL